MPDYTAVFIPSNVITMTASTAVSGGDPVEVSGNGTVARAAAANSVKYVGIAGNDTPANGRVTVFTRSFVHEGFADGAITAGDQVSASSVAGRQVKTQPPAALSIPATFDNVATQTAINALTVATRSVIGVALTTAADGAKVRWMQT